MTQLPVHVDVVTVMPHGARLHDSCLITKQNRLIGLVSRVAGLKPRSLSDFRRKSFVFNNSDFLA